MEDKIMEFVNTKSFCRNLTADERKQIKASGELAGIDYSAPLLAWKATKSGNEIRFFEVWGECLFESPIFHYVAIKNSIVIIVNTSGAERMFFFEVSEYAAALDFYNKMTEALKNSNAA